MKWRIPLLIFVVSGIWIGGVISYGQEITGEVIVEIMTGEIVNGELVFTETGQMSTSLETGSIEDIPSPGAEGNEVEGYNSGEELQSIPSLSITEVFFDGYDEWIEITNLGSQTFSGTLTLSGPSIGANSFTISTNVLANQSQILTKQGRDIQIFRDTTIKGPTIPLSLSDTKAIFLQLYYHTGLLDQFYAETGLITSLDNKKTSIEKLQIGNTIHLTGVSSERIRNLTQTAQDSGNKANPGKYFILTTTSPNPTPTSSGEVDNTQFLQTILSGTTKDTGWIEITEIYMTNGVYPSFIELKFLQNYSGTLEFSGTLLQEKFTLGITGEKGNYFLITNSANGWLSEQKIIENTSLYLVNNGFLMISGQSGQVLDIANILSTIPGKSLYHSDFDDLGVRRMEQIDNFSPGFPRSFLEYFKPSNSSCEQTNTPISSPTNNSGQTTPPPTPVNSIPAKIKILAVNSGDPESITLQSLDDQTVDLSLKTYYIISRKLSSPMYGTTKRYIYGMLEAGQTKQFTQNFSFSNEGVCVGIFTTNYTQIDEFCQKITDQDDSEEKPGTGTTLSGEILSGDNLTGIILTGTTTTGNIGQRSIQEILPYPLINKPETILLSFTPSNNSGVAIQSISTSGRYFKTTKKRYLTGIMTSGNQLLMIGTFGFANSKAKCIELRYRKTKIQDFCYPHPKRGVVYTQTSSYDPEQQGLLTFIQTIQRKVIDKKLCALSQQKPLFCKTLPVYKNPKEQQELKSYRQFTTYLKNDLLQKRPTLYYDGKLQDSFTILSTTKQKIKQGKKTDFDKEIALKNNGLSIELIIQTTIYGAIEALFK